MKKYKLKCFRCQHIIEKGEVYRDEVNYPLCKDCMADHLYSCYDVEIDEYWNCLVEKSIYKFLKKYVRVFCKVCGDRFWWERDLVFECPECLRIKENNLCDAYKDNFSVKALRWSPKSTIRITAFGIYGNSDCGFGYLGFQYIKKTIYCGTSAMEKMVEEHRKC